MEENKTFESRINELRDQLNRMEMLDEISKADLTDCANELLFNRFREAMIKTTCGFVDIVAEPTFRAAANSILRELQLEEIPDEITGNDAILEKFNKALECRKCRERSDPQNI